MAEKPQAPEPKSAERPAARQNPSAPNRPVNDPPKKTLEEILEEDRFQSTDN